jgi:hypothetical protein
MALLLIGLVILWPQAACADLRITNVRIGFAPPRGAAQSDGFSYFKAGNWVPIVVRIKGSSTGVLFVETTDSDDVQNRYGVAIAPRDDGKERDVLVYTKPGSLGADIRITLEHDSDQKQTYVAEKDYQALDFSNRLYLLIGSHSADLDLAVRPLDPDPEKRKHYSACVDQVSQLPDRWFGYEGVDLVILSTGDRIFLNQLLADRRRSQALVEWVRRGGRLIISVAPENSALTADLLASWKPAFPPVVDRRPAARRQLPRFVWYAEAYDKPFETKNDKPIPITHLRTYKGRGQGRLGLGPLEVLIKEDQGQVLMLRLPYGLGRVTLVAVDLVTGSLSEWKGKSSFWQKLLTQLGPKALTSDQTGSTLTPTEESDIATDLQKELEVSEDVQPVSFGWVAFFIFLYILAVGPLDYLFLKKVVGRLEWTWVTFPLVIIGVTVAAFYTSSAIQGKEPRINKVDLVDIDQLGPKAELQGTSWFALFSPANRRYTISLEPAEMWTAAKPEGRSLPVLSALGRPETGGLNSTGRSRAQTLFRAGYDYAPDAAGLLGVPVLFGSTKSFVATWDSTLDKLPFTTTLTYDSRRHERLSGKVTSHLPVVLEEPALFFGGKWYRFTGPLRPGISAELVEPEPREFNSWRNSLPRGVQPHPRAFDARALMTRLLFHDKLTEGSRRRNHTLRHLDQSWRLRDINHHDSPIQEAILIGRLPRLEGPAEEVAENKKGVPSRLWLGSLPGEERKPLSGSMIQDTYVRVFLPVPADRPGE